MTTNSAKVAPSVPFTDARATNPAIYDQAVALGLNAEGSAIAAQFPDYLRYCRVVHPKDYVVALAMGPKQGGMTAVLIGLGYPADKLPTAATARDVEDIRPKGVNW